MIVCDPTDHSERETWDTRRRQRHNQAGESRTGGSKGARETDRGREGRTEGWREGRTDRQMEGAPAVLPAQHPALLGTARRPLEKAQSAFC